MNEDDPHRETEVNEAGMVCTSCLAENSPRADYCAKCGAPLNSLVAFSPFEQTLLEGYAYRRAVDGPPNRIILIGIWLLFGPALLLLPLSLFREFPEVSSSAGFEERLVGHLFLSLYLVLAVVILYRTTANYFRKRPVDALGDV